MDSRYNTLAEYQGYSNFFTWNVMLWINNDEGLYNHFKECKKEYQDKYELAKFLQEEIQEKMPHLEQSMYLEDILMYSLEKVNWEELADYMLKED